MLFDQVEEYQGDEELAGLDRQRNCREQWLRGTFFTG